MFKKISFVNFYNNGLSFGNGSNQATTYALGEEGGENNIPSKEVDKISTKAIGEEGGIDYTKLNDSYKYFNITTYALGEEGGSADNFEKKI